MATKQNSTSKAKTCQVNRERWARLIPDQPECTKPTVRPAAALCQRHEKMLPASWRKLFNEHRAARRAEREGAKTMAAKPKAKRG